MEKKLLILGIGVSPEKNDGVLRFEAYCKNYGLDYRILGAGEVWHGGDMAAGRGGGQKINEMYKALEQITDNSLVIICDTFDLFPIASVDEILKKFHILCKAPQVLFSSEVYCWPDSNLAIAYPQTSSKYKYLNSGSLMGYRNDIFALLQNSLVADNDDDQLFFTLQYLERKNKIVIDFNCELFQTINGAGDDLVVHKSRIYNKYTNSYPIFLHGNGNSKLKLNIIENYVGNMPFDYTLSKTPLLESEPLVFFALYIDSTDGTKLDIFMENFRNITYSNRIVYIYDAGTNPNLNYEDSTNKYVYKSNSCGYFYDDFLKTDALYYFLLEQRCIITKKNILHELIPLCSDYRRIISPLLISNDPNNKFFTNYWGALDANGFYKRSDDYMDIISRNKRDIWNVPHVSGAILMQRDVIKGWDLKQPNKFTDNNTDMELCYNLRRNTLHMYTTNLNIYGYLN